MDVKLKKLEDKVSESLKSLMARGKSGKAFIQAYAYPKYLEHQMLRWASQNWGSWPALNPKYAEYKKRKFANYPGQGERMMIATGKLYQSVIGENKKYHVRIITENELIVGINLGGKNELEYARFANELRPFMDFKTSQDKSFIKDLKEKYTNYLRGGK